MLTNCWKSLISIILSFQERYKIGIIHFVTLGIAFYFSLSIIPSRFIRAVVCINSSLLLIAELYSMAWMYHCWFNHSAAKGHLGCFWVFAVTVKLLRIFIYKCLCEHSFVGFFLFFCFFLEDKCPGVQLLGHGNCMVSCLRNRQIVFQNSWPFYIPTSNGQVIQFFTSFPAFGVITILFLISILDFWCTFW